MISWEGDGFVFLFDGRGALRLGGARWGLHWGV